MRLGLQHLMLGILPLCTQVSFWHQRIIIIRILLTTYLISVEMTDSQSQMNVQCSSEILKERCWWTIILRDQMCLGISKMVMSTDPFLIWNTACRDTGFNIQHCFWDPDIKCLKLTDTLLLQFWAGHCETLFLECKPRDSPYQLLFNNLQFKPQVHTDEISTNINNI